MLNGPVPDAALSRLGRALADPTRCRILLALLEGPQYPAELALRLGLSRSNTSNHLSCLRGCGLVVVTHEGRQARYDMADRALRSALRDLLDVLAGAPPAATCRHDDPRGDEQLTAVRAGAAAP